MYSEIMLNCPSCARDLQVSQLRCHACNVRIEGDFRFARLARLPRDKLRLAELFILCSGNMKEIAARLDISYPTLRRHMDELIDALKALLAQDEIEAAVILKNIDEGKIAPEEGLRKIKEMNGEL